MASSSLDQYSTAEIEYELWRRYASHIRSLKEEIKELKGIVEDLVVKVKLDRFKVDNVKLPKTTRRMCSLDDLQAIVASQRQESVKAYARAYYAWLKSGRKGPEPKASFSDRLANQIRSKICPGENARPLGDKFSHWA